MEANERSRIQPFQLRSDLDEVMERVQGHDAVMMEFVQEILERLEQVEGELDEIRANQERQRQEQRRRPLTMRLRPRRNNRR